MKRNLSAPVLQLDGTPFPNNETLGSVCFMAVTAPMPGDESMGVEQKRRLYGIAQKVHALGDVDLTAEDIVAIKERVGKGFSVIVVGRVFEMLDADYQEEVPAVLGGIEQDGAG
jgi:hypothetical protein